MIATLFLSWLVIFYLPYKWPNSW